MQIPKNIKITNATGKTVAFLSPRADGLKDAYVDCRLNGESTLEFLIPATSEKIVELTPECEIWANDRVYILRKNDAIDTIRDEKNTLWTKFMAVEKWYELDTSYVEPSISNDPTARPPADLAVIIVGGGSNLTGGRYATGTAAHALYTILQGSGWTMGTVDVTGIRDLEVEKISRLGLVKMVQDIWGGYLLFDSVNKIIHLRDVGKWQPYTGFQVRYKKNLKHITRTQSNKIVTKLYPFGHDELDIAAINGGKKYITNHSYTSREYVGIYKNQDIYNQNELLEKASAELELICKPRYLYRVKMVDLRTLPEYEHEDFTLGDMIDLIDPNVAPDSPRPRIIRHKYNLFKPWECELDIGDPEERLVENLKASFNTTRFIDGKFNGNGQMSGNYLEDLTVTTDKIGDLQITSSKIDNLAVKSNHIANFAVTTNKIDSLAVTTDKIDNLAITSDKIDDFAIINSKIDSLAITNSKISNLTITGSKIANTTITDAKIKDLSADKITAGVIEATVELKAAKISSNSTINVGTDIYVGNNLYLGSIYEHQQSKSIVFSGGTVIRNAPSLTGNYGIEIDCETLYLPQRVHGNLTNIGGTISFYGDIDFSNANVTGL